MLSSLIHMWIRKMIHISINTPSLVSARMTLNNHVTNYSLSTEFLAALESDLKFDIPPVHIIYMEF